jgi:16S rRNA (cytosine967-C5)-methyltransferase
VLPITIKTGRHLVWAVLSEYDVNNRFLSDTFTSLDRTHELSQQDRAFAVDVASGIVRRRRTLDALIQSQISRPRAYVEADLWRLLQIGVYQLVFTQTPEHAAVDTTVELARHLGKARWTGFANGVLRSITRLLTADHADGPARNAVPMADGTYRKLAADVLPDPLTEPAEYLATAFSLPDNLAKRWSDRIPRQLLYSVAFHAITPPKLTIRVNRLRSSAAEMQRQLADAGFPVVPGDCADSLIIEKAARISDLPGFSQGFWSVQDESSMQPAFQLSPQPEERILDLCAAPGGKTTHLAELSDDKATIIACDVSDHKLSRIRENVDRLGLTSIETCMVDRDSHDVPQGPFDAALVDAPCSNTGVLSRRPEARWRFRETDLQELTEIQTRLMMTAFDRLKDGGRMVYSTCSIEPEETTELIKQLTAAVPNMVLQQETVTLPGARTDGGYCALLKRDDSRQPQSQSPSS